MPAAQLMQTAPVSDALPAMHAEHDDAPAGDDVPGSHIAQLDEPALAAKVPAAHAVHMAALDVDE